MLTVCIGCGCTDDNPCTNLAGQRCRWTGRELPEHVPPGKQPIGLCSFCAGIPLQDLIDKMARSVTL